MKDKTITLCLLLSIFFFWTNRSAYAQYQPKDTIRGKLHEYRRCFDVTYYDLSISVDPQKKFIAGSNAIHYKVTEDFEKIQLDLFKNMKISAVTFQGKPLPFKRIYDAFMVTFPKVQKKGSTGLLTVHYEGKPKVAVNPPWDGGFAWAKNKGKDWVGVSCEGIGASLWWPCKDHLSDEPDSMRIRCEVPKPLMCISNGQLRKVIQKEKTTIYDWCVSYPINNYNVTLNIADYAHIHDTYTNPFTKDTLSLDYYVLPQNVKKAKRQFAQVKPMLKAFEKRFGPYPFWNDGYKLVETSYLGMEHQGAIAYGNGYANGYQNTDLSFSGIGMKFDYIIIHESGHEYWGNNISCSDHAEMWIHESWCTYAESIYVEELFGRKAAIQYLNGYKQRVENLKPMLAPFGVNASAPGDIYHKGALMLHTLRSGVDDDNKWNELMIKLNQHFRHRTTSTLEMVQYINKVLDKDWSIFFVQYLTQRGIPTLEFRKWQKKWEYRWTAVVDNFELPIKVNVDGNIQKIHPSKEWQAMKGKNVKVLEDLYYIYVKGL